MKHHSDDLTRRQGDEWSPFKKDVVEVIKCLSEDDLSLELLRNFYGIIQINIVNVEEGRGLYTSMAMINHSCVANSVYTFNNKSIILRANR